MAIQRVQDHEARVDAFGPVPEGEVLGRVLLVFGRRAGLSAAEYVRSGARAGNDPWDAWTLEWSTESPPPAYNFATLPVVRSRRPLWDLKHPEDPDWKYEQ